MENSVLSDAAGVQKNISKMYEEHAQSIGKSTNALTQAEKAQAVYNGIMAEASMFTGSAAEMANGYQGQQAQLNATSLELSRTLGESMMPILTQINSILLPITKGMAEFTKSHKGATSGAIVFTTTILSLTIALTAGAKVVKMYKETINALNVSTKALKVTMSGMLAVSAIAGIYSAIKTKTEELSEAQEKLNTITEQYNQIKDRTYSYSDKHISEMQQQKEQITEQLGLYEQIEKAEKEIQDLKKNVIKLPDGGVIYTFSSEINKLQSQVDNWTKKLEEAKKANGDYGKSFNEVNEKLKENSKFLDEANAMKNIKTAMDIKSVTVQQQEAAGLEQNARKMQKYLNIVKKGNTSTKAYQKAVKALATAYPDAVKKTADGQELIIEKVEDCIVAEKGRADQAWNTSQTTIKGNIAVIEKFLELADAAERDKVLQQQLADAIGLSYAKIIPTLTSVLNILKAIGSNTPWGVLATDEKKVKIPKSSSGGSKGSKSSKSYENKKLDNYIKLIEYKKSLDKLSLQQEIKMYQTALNKYAKTTDEKRNLRTKIYELNKELAQKEKALLDQQTEDYEVYIQKQKNLKGSAYDLTEQTKDYDKIIAMHQKYLKKIMKDKRLSLDERKELYREELQTVRDYEQQKRDLMVEQVDNTVSQLTNAITKQLEEAQEREKEAIDKNLEEVEKWKDARIDAINEEYDARIEAIEKELEALDKAEKQKTRDEEDAEHEKKKKRLEELIAFEHDATTKANYQKELDKLLEEYQKTLDKRALDDKKEALNEQKELLKEEQNNKTQAIEEEAEKQKEIYETQLEELEKYYDEQTKKAQETAEKMLLNVQKNQDKILELLQKYGDAYEITGQSLGEKTAQGIIQGIDKGLESKIKGVMQKIQDTIDANIEAKIKEWTKSNYKYESSANKPKQTNITITQQNYIEQNPEMPSETYRKLKNVSEKLAEEIEGL